MEERSPDVLPQGTCSLCDRPDSILTQAGTVPGTGQPCSVIKVYQLDNQDSTGNYQQ